ncbi:sigma-70 family RNA polymerase sigma factor [Paraliomyxa miuraensis]|uniref:sigma-70 family RNA polymerase sigma factor n=1 Tax=Paraliomyxa miuraensis TaxID=376150 RepID=UPI0022530932|nr:sigma-70 family RNA polymerase sigma factor [Paraliomyxa miuraensis]MCX4246783.1 sigma-70 family RNA polymerase sigma factor [Paraliomyxa miuraensis]
MPTDPKRSGACSPNALSPDDLRWLRALAGRLARSSDEADDLVQETWLAAEQAAGTPARSPRAWLLGVLRNRERMQRRSEARRRQREAHAHASGQPTELEAELELHRHRVLSTVREALDELDESDRALLLARYCDECLAPELAERMGLPASTVRSRLSRATARVRRSLDERWGGDRRAWAPAVLLIPSPLASGSTSTGWRALVMSAVGVKIAIAVVAISTGVGIWLATHEGTDERAPQATSAAEDPAATRTAIVDLEQTERAERTRIDHAPTTVSGRVLLADTAEPVAGALVMITEQGPLAPTVAARLLTAADGRFSLSLSGLPAGHYSVTAAALGRLPARHTGLELRPGATEELELRLVPGGNVVEGTVVDIGGGPVERSLVQAYTSRTSDDRTSPVGTLTDAEGHYALSLPDGGWVLEAGGDDYTAQTRSVRVDHGPGRVDFELIPGAEIHGRVVERGTGTPVPDAVVTFGMSRRLGNASIHGASERHQTAVSDAQGRFLLRPLAPAEYALYAAAPGLATAAAATVHVELGEEVTGIEVPVDPAFDASGFVVTKDDPSHGLGGVLISLLSEGTDQHHFARTESDGHFELPGLLPGSYVMLFEGGGVIPTGLEHRLSITDANVTDALFELEQGVVVTGRVEPPGPGTVRVRGRVEHGGFEVLLQSAKLQNAIAPVAEDGSFIIHGVPPGEWTVVAEIDDGSHGRLDVDVTPQGLQNVAIGLVPRSHVSGVVLDAEGHPLAGVTLRLEDEADPSRPKRLRRPTIAGEAVSAADGTFVVFGVEPGRHALRLDDARHQPIALLGRSPTTVETIAGRNVDDLELRAELPHGRIEGMILGPDGEPLADAWVVAVADDGRGKPSELDDPPTTLTQADGRFVLEGLADRPYDLHARGPDANTRGTAEDVAIGSTVSLTLEALGAIEGKVTHAGAPVTHFQLDYGLIGSGRSVISRDGTFTLPRLGAAQWRVAVSTDEGAASETVTVVSGEASRVTLEIGAWGSIEGIAVAPDGTPLAGVSFVVGSDSGRRQIHERRLDALLGDAQQTDDDGRFSAEGIGPGRAWIKFRRDRRGQAGSAALGMHELTLAPGQALDLGTIVVQPPEPEPEP